MVRCWIQAMKVGIWIIACALGALVYLSLELTLGSYGVVAYHNVEQELERATVAYQSAQQQREYLLQRIDALNNDPETIRSFAHDLGLLAADERWLRIVGWNRSRRRSYSAGPAPIVPARYTDSRPLFRALGLFTTLLAAIVMHVLAWRNDQLGVRSRHSK